MDKDKQFTRRIRETEFTLTCPFPCCGRTFRLSYEDAHRYVNELDTELFCQLIDLEIEVKGIEALQS